MVGYSIDRSLTGCNGLKISSPLTFSLCLTAPPHALVRHLTVKQSYLQSFPLVTAATVAASVPVRFRHCQHSSRRPRTPPRHHPAAGRVARRLTSSSISSSSLIGPPVVFSSIIRFFFFSVFRPVFFSIDRVHHPRRGTERKRGVWCWGGGVTHRSAQFPPPPPPF